MDIVDPFAITPPNTAGGIVDPFATPAPQISTAADVAESVPTGAVEGLVQGATAVPSVVNLVNQGIGHFVRKSNPDWPTQTPPLPVLGDPGTLVPRAMDAIKKVLPLHEPQTGAGQIAKTGASFATSAPFFGAAGKADYLKALLSGVTSEGAGQFADKYLPSWMSGPARWVGALAGPGLPAAGRRTITPNPVTDAKLASASKGLTEAGIPQTAGEATGGKVVSRIEKGLGPSATSPNEALTANVMQSIGSEHKNPFDLVTPTGEAIPAGATTGGERLNALAAAKQNISDGYNNFFKQNQVLFDPAVVQPKLNAIADAYEGTAGITAKSKLPGATQQAPSSVRQAVNDIIYGKSGVPAKNSNVAGIDGERYQFIKDSLDNKLASAQTSAERDALYQVRKELGNIFEGGLPADKLAQLKDLNNKYSNYKIASIAPEKGGVITPESLAKAAKQYLGTARYNEFRGPSLAHTARQAETVLKREAPSQSDISKALSHLAHGGLGGSILGFSTWGLNHALGNPAAESAGLATGLLGAVPMAMAGSAAARGAYYNPLTQWFLKNQKFLPPAAKSGLTSAPDKEALLRALAQKGSVNQGPAPSQ